MNENPNLSELCAALGWQGGTIHQVIEEVKRLKKVEQVCKSFVFRLANEDWRGHKPGHISDAQAIKDYLEKNS